MKTKLSEDTKKLISFSVKYCRLLKIESLLIDKKGIRAKQDEFAAYLIEPGDFDFLEFDILFIDRISSLSPRIEMFEKSKIEYDMFIETKELDNSDHLAREISVKGGRTNIKFNCANPALLNKNSLPKKVNDPIYFEFKMDKQCLDVLNRGVSAMGAEELCLYSEGGAILANVKDIEGDVLTHKVNDSFKAHSDEKDFKFNYIFKMILPLLREACKQDDFNIEITRNGIMKLNINDLSMYIFPEL